MAGDWIKMRIDIADDPAVIGMASALDITEDEVVGKLHRIWSWADKHTASGFVPRITGKWLDRYINLQGFSEQMQAVGWLVIADDGVTFPSFDRHNGKSAKSRAENTERARNSRKSRDESVTSVKCLSQKKRDESVTREEKRREEKKEPKTPAAPAGALDPEAFDEAWQEYPKREGSNSRPAAVKAWNARIRSGASAADIVAGVKRYAAYCAAKGSVGTSFVKQAAVFFGPDAHWSEPWSVQPAQPSYPASRPAPPGKMWVGGLLADI